MSARTLFFVSILFFFALTAHAASTVVTNAGETYLSAKIYSGLYKGDRLYQLNSRSQTWLGDQRFKRVAAISCFDARQTLSSKGIWIGNLLENGSCAGTAEAPTWASGNYLNYLLLKGSAQ